MKLFAYAEVVDDRINRELKTGVNSLVLKKKGGVVQLILKDQIGRIRPQPFHQVLTEVVQEMSGVGSPGEWEKRDSVSMKRHSLDYFSVIQESTSANRQISVINQTNVHSKDPA